MLRWVRVSIAHRGAWLATSGTAHDPGFPRGQGAHTVAAGTRVKVARVYDAPVASAGMRVLVDRIWPRGLSKDQAHLDEWCKAVAPSTELRTWYNHDPERYDEFARRYREELTEPERAEAVRHLSEMARQHGVTLLTASKAVGISQASVLADVLRASRD